MKVIFLMKVSIPDISISWYLCHIPSMGHRERPIGKGLYALVLRLK